MNKRRDQKEFAGTSRRKKDHANHHKVTKEMSYLCELEEFLPASSLLTSAKVYEKYKSFIDNLCDPPSETANEHQEVVQLTQEWEIIYN